MKEYQVLLIDKNNKSDNKTIANSVWEKANCLTDFCSPWSDNLFSKIEFRALWDLDNLYFNFRIKKSDVYIDKTDDSFDSIGNSDRVELFFRSNELLSPYYCLEIDTEGRIMDFEAYPDWNFDFNWKWPKKDITVVTSTDGDVLIVEGRISIESLNMLQLIKNDTIETGVYRAKFSKADNDQYVPTWISWVNPNTEKPNFHIASSFGKFILMR